MVAASSGHKSAITLTTAEIRATKEAVRIRQVSYMSLVNYVKL